MKKEMERGTLQQAWPTTRAKTSASCGGARWERSGKRQGGTTERKKRTSDQKVSPDGLSRTVGTARPKKAESFGG